MKIVIVGVLGWVGFEIIWEFVCCGYVIIVIVWNFEWIVVLLNVMLVKGDVLDQVGFVKLWSGYDVVVSFVYFLVSDLCKLIGVVKDVKVGCYFVVGGVGSFEVVLGVKFVIMFNFLVEYKVEVEVGLVFLDLLWYENELDWIFILLLVLFVEGECIGKFCFGCDQFFVDVNGKSWIIFFDYVIVFVDEIECLVYLW